jgi:protease IV
MHPCRTAALLLLACAASWPLTAHADPDLPRLVTGNESAAATDGALALRFNPAALGTRYPSEALFGFSHTDGKLEWNDGLLTVGRSALQYQHVRGGPKVWGAGFSAGGEKLRFGWASDRIVDGNSHSHTSDHRLGLLAHVTPWLALGGVTDHVFQPSFLGETLRRSHTMALGLRPLALMPAHAHDWGTRLTFTVDVIADEGSGWRDRARVRVGAEFEPLRGFALTGSLEDHGGAHVGVAFRGVRSSLQASARLQDGDRIGESYAVSFHDGDEPTSLAKSARGRVAVIRAGGELGDDALGGVSIFGATSVSPVRPLHEQLTRALEDPLTRGVLLDLHGVSNMAQIEELRPHLAHLRAAGKPVVAFLEEGATRGDLYLAAPSDRIVTTEEAQFGALGLRVERRSYRSLLESWGVRIDRTSYGKYKSAFREFSMDSTRQPDRESINHILDARQELFVAALAADRHVARDRFLPVLDGRAWRAVDVQRMGLVDSIGYHEDALRILGRLCRLGDRPHTVNLGRVALARRAWVVPAPIAVVYAAGAIESGHSGNDLLLGPSMGSATVVRQLERAFQRRGVKAVVLRVESPGGSTIASDLILHATVRLKRETKKPLIVSMGEDAASGGYYISAHGDRLYADRFTYTGSIGVLQIKPSLEGWYRHHDVKQEDFDRGRFMSGWSTNRDWTPEMQASADSATFAYYTSFVAKVAEGRKMSWADVDHVAQGRVWLGEDALANHLVDEIGGLDAALAEARRRGGVPVGERIRLVEYRRPRAGLVQRLIGANVSEALARSARLPEPGAVLYWNDDAIAP